MINKLVLPQTSGAEYNSMNVTLQSTLSQVVDPLSSKNPRTNPTLADTSSPAQFESSAPETIRTAADKKALGNSSFFSKQAVQKFKVKGKLMNIRRSKGSA